MKRLILIAVLLLTSCASDVLDMPVPTPLPDYVAELQTLIGDEVWTVIEVKFADDKVMVVLFLIDNADGDPFIDGFAGILEWTAEHAPTEGKIWLFFLKQNDECETGYNWITMWEVTQENAIAFAAEARAMKVYWLMEPYGFGDALHRYSIGTQLDIECYDGLE
jgi:hypothetical protein